MKRTYFIYIFLIGLLYIGCEPSEMDKPGLMAPPTADQLSFTLSPGSDVFHVVITNTSSVTGIAHWDFGNGSKDTGDEVTVKYNLEGTYTITLTLVTNGGSTSITQEYVQAETDFSIFNDPVYVNLSGGTTATEGRTWMLDSLQKGHLGVGPSNDPAVPNPTGLEWWSADPLVKSGTAAYDDEINFNINQFVVTYDNKGKSYVKGYRTSDPAYSNPVQNKDDYDVNYTTPVSGSWTISERNGAFYLSLNAATPIFPGLDVGAKNNEYKIIQITENLLELTCYSNDEDWTYWHYYLIPKGYVKPKITFDLVTAPTGNDNEFTLRLNNIVYPENGNLSITNVTWDFGDPSQEAYETSNPEEVVTVTYMPAGTYTVKVTFTDNAGTTYEATEDIIVATDHPDYTPYIEANMMMYTNFDDYFRPIGIDGGGGSFKLVANPSVVYQNESAFCVEFTKVDDPWANIYIQLSDAYRFDLVLSNKFKLLVYGTAGNEVLLKLENKDLGGNSWTTGTPDQKYTIQESNKWEVAEFTLTGVDADKLQNYYNRILVMLNAGNGSGTFTVKIDDWAGPLVSGWKK